MLESKGYPLALATSSAEALSLGRQLGFAAVIIDLTTADDDVVNLARRLRADAALRSTPMLLLAARPPAMTPSDAALMDGAPFEVVHQPVDAAALVAAMQRLTSVQRANADVQASLDDGSSAA